MSIIWTDKVAHVQAFCLGSSYRIYGNFIAQNWSPGGSM